MRDCSLILDVLRVGSITTSSTKRRHEALKTRQLKMDWTVERVLCSVLTGPWKSTAQCRKSVRFRFRNESHSPMAPMSELLRSVVACRSDGRHKRTSHYQPPLPPRFAQVLASSLVRREMDTKCEGLLVKTKSRCSRLFQSPGDQ